MSSIIPRYEPCSLPGCVVDLGARPGRRVFHGDPDPVYNDAPSQLVVGDELHDGWAVYTWVGDEWALVVRLDLDTRAARAASPA